MSAFRKLRRRSADYEEGPFWAVLEDGAIAQLERFQFT
jgi:hypothetical protein